MSLKPKRNHKVVQLKGCFWFVLISFNFCFYFLHIFTIPVQPGERNPLKIHKTPHPSSKWEIYIQWTHSPATSSYIKQNFSQLSSAQYSSGNTARKYTGEIQLGSTVRKYSSEIQFLYQRIYSIKKLTIFYSAIYQMWTFIPYSACFVQIHQFTIKYTTYSVYHSLLSPLPFLLVCQSNFEICAKVARRKNKVCIASKCLVLSSVESAIF